MDKICRFCGARNDDGRIFCAECGEALDEDLNFLMQAEKYEKSLRSGQSAQRRTRPRDDDDTTPLSPIAKEKDKGSPLPLLLLLLAAVAAGAYFFFLR